MWLSPCYARRVLLHSGLYCLFWKVSSHIIVVVTSNSENWTSKNRVYYIPSFCREGHFSVIWKLSTSQHFPTYQQHSRVLFGEKRHWGFLQGGDWWSPRIIPTLHNLHICSCQLSLKSHLNPFVKRARYANDIGTITHGPSPILKC